MKLTVTSITFFAFIIVGIANAMIDCDDVLKTPTFFKGQCNNKWSNLKLLLKPTQSQVGYAWIQRKLDSSFSSSSDAQDEMDSNLTPGVIGPDNYIYIIDDHHTLSALDFSGYDSTVIVDVICDKRSSETMDKFWSEMETDALVYLGVHPDSDPNRLPVSISPTELPQRFSFTAEDMLFTDDPWRSITSYSRKIEDDNCPSSSKNCARCFYRGCIDGYRSEGSGVPFFEFQWAYMLLDATYYNRNLWPTSDDWSTFYNAYNKLPASEIGNINVNDWQDVAEYLIPLCRAPTIRYYSVPSDIFVGWTNKTSSLPGYILGDKQLEDDPECLSPECSY